jgi:hypothetical protein
MYDILPDTGGMLMVPVDTDLRLYSKTREGKPKSKVVSSVRFQDLEVSRDKGGERPQGARQCCQWYERGGKWIFHKGLGL